ncbi:MAG TPA: bifunctional riboflavin kinase/FAD synthetase [Bryobacteraceae bacterium]|nr:bifunctional riboflavin kinase/FAD synthetase [Bryobacteraceae bacterium]
MTAVTIGNFDGVHIGHRRIFERVVELARAHDWTPAVLTFDPHPAKIVAPTRAPKLLSTLEQRFSLMRAAGIQQIEVIPFDRTFSELSPEEFACRILMDRLDAKAVLVGENFRFGNKQSGDIRLLRELGDKYGFLTEIISGIRARGRVVSSSQVRQLIEHGQVSMVCRMLARPYEITGQVVTGHGIGSKQTVPTLNLKTAAEVIPATGVYITRTQDPVSGRSWNSITNVGYRPTFGGDELTIETFLLEPLAGDPPGQIQLSFLRRVREERRFDTPGALKTQILQDVTRAQTYFRRTGRL